MTPGLRGFYEGTDKEGRLWRLPRNVDPEVDGLALLSPDRVPRFDVSDPPDSIELVEFDRRIEATVPPAALERVAHVMAAGALLANRGLADRPPLELDEWRRGLIISWCHARDLDLVHQALGHPRRLTDRHDVDESVLAIRLRPTVEGADQWYQDYIDTLDDGAWVNVGFFNPHLSASLYKWGDARHGVQNAMNAHRLSAHHQGTEEAPLDWVERAVNFVVHHIPREHWGIRHEPRGEYSDLEARLADDPAIKDAEIGKQIARDAAKLFELLEDKGYIIPWGKLKLPGGELTPSIIEHSYCLVSLQGAVGVAPSDEPLEPRRLERAKTVLSRLPEAIEAARRAGREDLVVAYESFRQRARP